MCRYIILIIVACACCRPSPESNSTTDSVAAANTATDKSSRDTSTFRVISSPFPDTVSYSEESMPYDVINMVLEQGYSGYDLRRNYEFEPFKKIHAAGDFMYKYYNTLDAIHVGGMKKRDSISKDSAENKAYELILRYKEQLKSGVTIPIQKGRIDLGRFKDGDQTRDQLRESTSSLLNNVDFTFLGGEPFVFQDEEVYKDQNGNPEAHYFIDIPKNSNIFFNYLYSRNPVAIEITYGPPLSLYGGDELHVKNIGSLKHHLKNGYAVWFLTKGGVIPATLVSVELNISSRYGCYSNYPKLEFACSKNIDRHSIFGIFASEKPMTFDSGSTLPMVDNNLWEYDLDGDDSADIARVATFEENAASGDLIDVIWFARIDGEWKILDVGFEPGCT